MNAWHPIFASMGIYSATGWLPLPPNSASQIRVEWGLPVSTAGWDIPAVKPNSVAQMG